MALFNNNVPYSGLLHAVTQEVSRALTLLISLIVVVVFQGLFAENKEKLINASVTALLSLEGQQDIPSEELEAHFHALRRLFASKAGFHGFTNLPG